MTRSVSFYKDILGLSLKFESNDWSEFTTGPTTIALHGGGIARTSQMSQRGELLAGTCTIGFNVDDLDRTFKELKAKGANFVTPPTRRAEEGIHLAVCLDPDGLPISIAQPISREENPVAEASS